MRASPCAPWRKDGQSSLEARLPESPLPRAPVNPALFVCDNAVLRSEATKSCAFQGREA